MPDEGGATLRDIAFIAVSSAFGSLGRVCMALDAQFRIPHVSPQLDEFLGPGAAARFLGQPAEGVLGPKPVGAGGAFRQALEAGECREGWEPSGARLLSVTAAPLRHDASGECDPEAHYLVILRPAEQNENTRGAAPTVSVRRR